MLHKARLAFILFVVASSILQAQERTWKDSTGKHTVVGELVEVTDAGVLLKKSDGATKLVPLEKLSTRDRKYAKAKREKAVAKQLEAEAAANRVEVFGKRTTAVWPAKVVGIADGDTINVLNENKEQIRIRLEAIDTPEKGQPFGQKSKDALGAMLKGR